MLFYIGMHVGRYDCARLAPVVMSGKGWVAVMRGWGIVHGCELVYRRRGSLVVTFDIVVCFCCLVATVV